MSKSLDPDQDRRFESVGPGLCQNCLQRLSADGKLSRHKQEEPLAGSELINMPLYRLLIFFKINFFKKLFQLFQ